MWGRMDMMPSNVRVSYTGDGNTHFSLMIVYIATGGRWNDRRPALYTKISSR